jgi:GNAT superfamily N-acetyltransferase
MPVVDDPGRANGRLLLDGAGETVAAFEYAERDGVPRADMLAPADGVRPERAVATVMAELRGWRIAGEEPFARLVVAAGGHPRRHVHAMTRDLTRAPAPGGWLEPNLPAGVRLTPVDRPAADLMPALSAAFPTDHPDHGEVSDPQGALEDLISGRLMGPLLRCSALAVLESGDVAGAILVNNSPEKPPFGGPWIADLFRDPAARGIGSALLKRALAVATRDRLPAVGLAVTHANSARSLYAAHGFIDVWNGLNVDVP